jgi:hypothetical protein
MARSPRFARAQQEEVEMKTKHLHDLPCFRGHLETT